MRKVLFLLHAVSLILLVGCGGGSAQSEGGTVSWEDLLREVTDRSTLARVDVPSTTMHSTFDRTGANSSIRDAA